MEQCCYLSSRTSQRGYKLRQTLSTIPARSVTLREAEKSLAPHRGLMAGGAGLGAVYVEGTIRTCTLAEMSALGVKERSEACLPLLLLTAL